MTSTGVDDFADARPIRARPYRVVDKKIAPADHSHPSQPFAAGVLVSTVLDLVEWELEARKLLKPASYDAMWTPPTLPGRSLSEYAFGWYVDPLRGHRRHQHSGGITGYSAYLHRFPDDRLTVVVLSNHEDGGSTPLARGIAELYVPALKAP
jgi:D-alanyl-D-alanine carboxypeptidase